MNVTFRCIWLFLKGMASSEYTLSAWTSAQFRAVWWTVWSVTLSAWTSAEHLSTMVTNKLTKEPLWWETRKCRGGGFSKGYTRRPMGEAHAPLLLLLCQRNPRLSGENSKALPCTCRKPFLFVWESGIPLQYHCHCNCPIKARPVFTRSKGKLKAFWKASHLPKTFLFVWECNIPMT